MKENSKDLLLELVACKEEIIEKVSKIENILKRFFPKEYDQAYQHYIPQILTSLDSYEKWLPRSAYTLQDSITHISESVNSRVKQTGVKKFIS